MGLPLGLAETGPFMGGSVCQGHVRVENKSSKHKHLLPCTRQGETQVVKALTSSSRLVIQPKVQLSTRWPYICGSE